MQKNLMIYSLNKQKGAAMIFIAGFMIIMAIMTVLATNVGQLVFDKIRLQQTVDQAALGAANIQSIGLNEIADLNRAAFEEYENALAVLSSVPWFDAGQAESEVRYFEEIFYWLNYYREDANNRFATLAVDYANATVAENLPGLYDQGLLEIAPVDGSSLDYLTDYEIIPMSVPYSYYTSSCGWPPCLTSAAFYAGGSTPKFISPDRRQSSRALSIVDRTAPVPGLYVPEVLWAKFSPPITYSAYQITQTRDQYAISGTDKLADLYPELKVYSSAKPSQGLLVSGEPTYVPLLKHLIRHDPEPNIDYLDEIQH